MPRPRYGLPARAVLAVSIAALASACASSPPSPSGSSKKVGVSGDVRARAAQHASAMLGRPYRYGGNTPRGFDCSGLVTYSFAMAGLDGLPHSARQLERRARPVALSELRPGDLLFFSLSGPKTSHVAIYTGDRAFVHAPSAGKKVERVPLDHVYWGRQLTRAGRIVH